MQRHQIKQKVFETLWFSTAQRLNKTASLNHQILHSYNKMKQKKHFA